ncbi:hypothetical protein pb186bvf_020824 [Paramecium bursaria]
MQKDRYRGEQNPITKVRNGYGTYIYENSFFRYEGEWLNGVKHGRGVLKMNDGSYYEGQFQNGEIEGDGRFVYQNGSQYEGNFHRGEKHGKGRLDSQDIKYNGDWHLNLMHGEGVLITKNYTIKGQFINNKPDGICSFLSDSYNYEGQYSKGLKHGTGQYKSENEDYDGLYENDLKNGEGTLYKRVSDYPNYVYEGLFKDDQPLLQVNTIKYKLDPVPEEPIDPKAKKGESVIDLTQILVYEFKSGKFINFELNLVYQGPDIEDPVQPSAQEIDELVKNWQKEAKKQKNPPPMPDFAAKRMMKPAPILVQQESGRQLQIQLVQKLEQGNKLFRVDYREKLKKRREEIEKIKVDIEAQKLLEEQQQQAPVKSKKDTKKQTKKQEPEVVDLSIKLYNEQDQEPLIVESKNGAVRVEFLEYPEDFPPGKYFYVIQKNSPHAIGQFQPCEIELNINPEGGTQQKKKK